MLSGGSTGSVSVACAAATVTTQLALFGSAAAGVSVKVVAGETVCVNPWGAPSQFRVKADAALTLSLNVTVIVEVTGTAVAPVTGEVLVTAGAVSPPAHGASGVAELRGAGVPAEKSARFESVSVQPLAARSAAVVFARVGAVSPPSAQFAPPYPIRSTVPDGQAPLSAAVPLTRATFPAVAAIRIVPVASAAMGMSAPRMV